MKVVVTKMEFMFADVSTLAGKDILQTGVEIHYVIFTKKNELKGKKTIEGKFDSFSINGLTQKIEEDIQLMLADNGS